MRATEKSFCADHSHGSTECVLGAEYCAKALDAGTERVGIGKLVRSAGPEALCAYLRKLLGLDNTARFGRFSDARFLTIGRKCRLNLETAYELS